MDPPCPVAEVDHVEVHFEDLLLGVDLLQPDRQDRFLYLSLEGLLLGEEEVPRKLLGYRAGALDGFAAPEVHPEGPDDPDEVEAPVAVKGAVLSRDGRLLHDQGDLGKGYPGPVLMKKPGDDFFVPVVNDGGQVRFIIGHFLQRREGRGRVPDEQDAHNGSHGEKEYYKEGKDQGQLAEKTGLPGSGPPAGPPGGSIVLRGPLGLSVRQIQRIKTGYEEAGASSLVHRNTGRKPSNFIPTDIRACLLYTSRCV